MPRPKRSRARPTARKAGVTKNVSPAFKRPVTPTTPDSQSRTLAAAAAEAAAATAAAAAAAIKTTSTVAYDDDCTSDDTDGIVTYRAGVKRRRRSEQTEENCPMMSGALGPGEERPAHASPRTKRFRLELTRIAREADYAKDREDMLKRKAEAEAKTQAEAKSSERNEVKTKNVVQPKPTDNVKVPQELQQSVDGEIDDSGPNGSILEVSQDDHHHLLVHRENGEDTVQAQSTEADHSDSTSTSTQVMENNDNNNSSMMVIANFKRRPRQPSILRMVQAEQENDDGGDDDEFDIDMDGFRSEAASTPTRTILRVDDRSTSPSQLPELLVSELPSSPPKRKAPNEGVLAPMSDTVAPPASTSSSMANVDNGDGSAASDVAAAKTGAIDESEKAGKGRSILSTATLQDLLPRRRRRRQRRQAAKRAKKTAAAGGDPEVPDPRAVDHGPDHARTGRVRKGGQKTTTTKVTVASKRKGKEEVPATAVAMGRAKAYNLAASPHLPSSFSPPFLPRPSSSSSIPPALSSEHSSVPPSSSDKENRSSARLMSRLMESRPMTPSSQERKKTKKRGREEEKGRAGELNLRAGEGEEAAAAAEGGTRRVKRPREAAKPAKKRNNTGVTTAVSTVDVARLSSEARKFKRVDEWELSFEDVVTP